MGRAASKPESCMFRFGRGSPQLYLPLRSTLVFSPEGPGSHADTPISSAKLRFFCKAGATRMLVASILDQDIRYTSWHFPVAAATSCQDMVT